MALPDGLRVVCPRCGATLQAGSTGHSACPLVLARIVDAQGRECDRYGNLLTRSVNTASDVNKSDRREYMRQYMASRRKKAGD